MANVLSKGNLFPEALTNQLFNLVRGKSALARLSGSEPIPFNGERVFTFNFDKEADLVAENGAKSNGGATISPVTITPVKIEYGMRVSNEFEYAADEIQIQYLTAFSEGFANKAARALDIMAFHGVNPRTGNAAAVLSDNNFDALIDQTVDYDSTAPQDNVQAAIDLIQGNEHDVTGMAISPTFKSALASLKQTKDSNVPLYPDLGWGREVSAINGLATDVNSTVSFGGSADKAIIGNFADYFKWGFARQIPIEIIRYGNPDNDAVAGDLKGHNQIYLRGEVFLGWGILVPDAFAIVKNGVSG